MRSLRYFLSALFFCTLTIHLVAQDGRTAILVEKMVDVVAGKLIENKTIVVEGGNITDILSGKSTKNYDTLIDLSGYTVLPGLIDCHTHLTDASYDKSIDVYETPIAAWGILGVIHAKATLEAGFTTVRDVGGDFYADVALRDAINKHWVPGPRMFVSGKALTITGGHGHWANWMAPQFDVLPNPGNPVDGVDEVLKRTRTLIRNNVDLIKINATGGFGSSRSLPGASSFSIEEMKTAVDEANKRGLRVAAHAHGTDGIKNAIAAGVHSIEHGTFLNEESIQLLKANDIFLVMDLLAAYASLIEQNEDISDKGMNMNNREAYDDFAANFKKAHEAGVKMAFGTDASIFRHGRNAEQFKLMHDAGMRPDDILRTATINAAALIGIEKRTGSLEKGKWADLIAVKGDPLQQIEVLEKVHFVMKAGKVYKTPE
ncbi:metal-dependent hydrolase family protein [Allomuricauda sp. SCSIO 65647]|uniref:metal-dependent hydrolase family protein n=1 Tax=Allomuricauda sp. SCSIO 65647 TaxID=2908843 RepID=UPI001F40A857|nr:amidohydrolase family protein [Muricauda sp. SCSIO 65647]UJH67717.1 amidohydrolase family protein [Muricauda sp. SCSIO 65647]